MKILYLAPNRLKNVGTHLTTRDVVTDLQHKGYFIDIKLLKDDYRGLFYPLIALYEAIQIFFVSRKYSSVILFSELFATSVLFILKKSIVVLHQLPPDLEKKDSSGRSSINSLLRYYYNKLILIFCRRCRYIVSTTEFTKQDYAQKYHPQIEKIKVIYNPINNKKFKNNNINKPNFLKKFRICYQENCFYMLYVGSEHFRKNFMLLLRALKLLDSNKYYLIKIGKDQDLCNRKIHQEFVRNNNLKVKFIDYVNDDDLVGFYNVCDVYINPSLFEGFGRTPIEAQSCGLPVISTNCAALKEVLANSTLILKNPNSELELKEAIEKMMQSRDTRNHYINKGYKNAARFSLDSQVEKWEKLISSIEDNY